MTGEDKRISDALLAALAALPATALDAGVSHLVSLLVGYAINGVLKPASGQAAEWTRSDKRFLRRVWKDNNALKKDFERAFKLEVEGKGRLDDVVELLMTMQGQSDAVAALQDRIVKHQKGMGLVVLENNTKLDEVLLEVRAIATQVNVESAAPQHVRTMPSRNARFVGREVLFEKVRNTLTVGTAAALTQRATLHGLGGVGKSETAIEYCHRYELEYDVIAWLRAEDEVTLRGDLVQLGLAAGVLKGDERDEETQVGAVLRWIGDCERTLLVYDNAESQGPLDVYLPSGTAHVLITSRVRDWGDVVDGSFDVDVFDEGEAVQFLLERTRRDDDQGAARLAKALGHLPLALQQAASYLAPSASLTFDDYIDALQKKGLDVLQRGKSIERYKQTVATTWDISIEAVNAEHPAALTLLEMCAYLAPDDIPLSMFREHPEQLPDDLSTAVQDALEWNDTITAVDRYSLARCDGDVLSVHRLVQDVIRQRCAEGERDDERLAGCVGIVRDALPEADFSNWDTCRRVLPHATALLERQPTSTRSVSSLHFRVARYHQDHASYALSLAHYQDSLAIDEAELGADHLELAPTLGNLGNTHQSRGDLDAAEASQSRALAIFESAYGPDHPRVAITLTNLGNIHELRGDLDAAEASQSRALTIKESAYGPDHPQVAITLTNLGNIHKSRGDLDAAEASQSRALEIKESAYGPDHPQVAITLTNLGNIHKSRGDLDAAEASQSRALAIFESAYGPNHPQVAITLGNLGNIYELRGDLDAAEASQSRALAIFKSAYGPDHPQVAITLGNLGNIHKARGDLEAGREAMSRAVDIFERRLGVEHPHSQQARRLLVAIEIEKNRQTD